MLSVSTRDDVRVSSLCWLRGGNYSGSARTTPLTVLSSALNTRQTRMVAPSGSLSWSPMSGARGRVTTSDVCPVFVRDDDSKGKPLHMPPDKAYADNRHTCVGSDGLTPGTRRENADAAPLR